MRQRKPKTGPYAKADAWLIANGWAHLTSPKLFALDITDSDLAWAKRHRMLLKERTFIRALDGKTAEFACRATSYYVKDKEYWVTRVETVMVAPMPQTGLDDLGEERRVRREMTKLLARDAHANALWDQRTRVLRAKKPNTGKVAPLHFATDPERFKSSTVGSREWLREQKRHTAHMAQAASIVPLTTVPFGSFYTASQKDFVR
ncbi:MAG: hypothetical protein E6R03_17245 [Hyphomicrobiaceae bacterium]|nr:MAG: hypothetical protein E6R03_17245 [Hyphomicrobiaceae bacterium]